jgi:hypothetical protein
MNDADLAALRRLQKLQSSYQHAKSQPTLAERQAFSSAADLRAMREARADPTPRSMLMRQAATLRLQQRRLAACARAWGETVQPYLAFDVALVDLSRGKLTVSVANHAHKYQLHTALRGGRERHFQQRCTAAVSNIVITVGEPPRTTISVPRQVRAMDERDSEVIAHIDQGAISPDQAAELASRLTDAERHAIQHDSGLT